MKIPVSAEGTEFDVKVRQTHGLSERESRELLRNAYVRDIVEGYSLRDLVSICDYIDRFMEHPNHMYLRTKIFGRINEIRLELGLVSLH
ncbi:MAG: hypothetical protein HYW26_05985 [Candidatus Aenigmarchaeota archaeon]|nr:hypothetical protein [Candidatus Aenigmarchaeota archaeon]